jgi:hypothetical protein
MTRQIYGFPGDLSVRKQGKREECPAFCSCSCGRLGKAGEMKFEMK